MSEEKDLKLTQEVDQFLNQEFGYDLSEQEKTSKGSVFSVEQPAQVNVSAKSNTTFMNSEYEGPTVSLLEPISYEDAKDIAHALFKGQVVFIKLSQLSDHQAGRIIDFMTGVVYGIDGDIQRVSEEMFICTPQSVEITDELLNRFERD